MNKRPEFSESENLSSQVENILGHYDKSVPYLAGISGGVDSMVLLALLAHSGFRHIIVVHVNHKIRGADADADATRVVDAAQKFSFPAEVVEVDVPARATAENMSVETMGRMVRWEAFACMGERYGTKNVFLAHHADDEIETFLFNLFRGTGVSGLTGMQPEREITINGRALLLLRPLLNIWKHELLAFAEQAGVQFGEDFTNEELEYARNRIRSGLLPELNKWMRRDIRANVKRTMGILALEDAFLETLIPAWAQEEKLPVAAMRELHPAMQRRVIRRWLMHHKIPGPDFRVIQDVLRLVDESETIHKINLPTGRHARRTAGWIYIETHSSS